MSETVQEIQIHEKDLVLPREILKHLGIKEGDTLIIQVKDDQILLRKKKNKKHLPKSLQLAINGPWFAFVTDEEIEKTSIEHQQKMMKNDEDTP